MKETKWTVILSLLVVAGFAWACETGPVAAAAPKTFIIHASEYLGSLGNVRWLENVQSHECYTVVDWDSQSIAITPASCPQAERVKQQSYNWPETIRVSRPLLERANAYLEKQTPTGADLYNAELILTDMLRKEQP